MPVELGHCNCSSVVESRVPGLQRAVILLVVVTEHGEVEEYLAPEWDLDPMIEPVWISYDTPCLVKQLCCWRPAVPGCSRSALERTLLADLEASK